MKYILKDVILGAIMSHLLFQQKREEVEIIFR